MLKHVQRLSAVGGTLVAGCAAFGQGRIIVVEPLVLPGVTSSWATGVSDDGRVVVGGCITSNTPLLGYSAGAFRWTAATGSVDLGTPPPGPLGNVIYSAFPAGVSGDGSVIAGTDVSGVVYSRSFMWTAANGMTDVGLLVDVPESETNVLAVSRDGLTMVGDSGGVAARYTAGSGLHALGGPAGYRSRAEDVNADGRLVVGEWQEPLTNYEYRAILWDSRSGEDLASVLPTRPGYPFSYAGCISADGQWIAGSIWGVGSYPWQGRLVRWRLGQTPEDLGQHQNFGTGAVSISHDGSIIVGNTAYPSGATRGPFIWTSQLGCVGLADYLAVNGVDLTGWTLNVVTGMSGDGSVMVGWGIHDLVQRGWVVRLRDACGSADFDNDGDTATDFDIQAFFACLGGTCCPTCGTADFDGDGDTGTDFDIQAFFRVLGGGSC